MRLLLQATLLLLVLSAGCTGPSDPTAAPSAADDPGGAPTADDPSGPASAPQAPPAPPEPWTGRFGFAITVLHGPAEAGTSTGDRGDLAFEVPADAVRITLHAEWTCAAAEDTCLLGASLYQGEDLVLEAASSPSPLHLEAQAPGAGEWHAYVHQPDGMAVSLQAEGVAIVTVERSAPPPASNP